MDKSLSGYEILNMLDNKCNLIVYPDLQNYKDIDEVLGKYGCTVILYLTSKDYGHWVCLIKHKDNVIEFFDSYGLPLDKEFGFITREKRNYLKQNLPYLSKLLYNSPYQVIYNDVKLQKDKKDINTCGRHVIMRIVNRNLDVDDYANILKTNKYYSPDEIVTILTS